MLILDDVKETQALVNAVEALMEITAPAVWKKTFKPIERRAFLKLKALLDNAEVF